MHFLASFGAQNCNFCGHVPNFVQPDIRATDKFK